MKIFLEELFLLAIQRNRVLLNHMAHAVEYPVLTGPDLLALSNSQNLQFGRLKCLVDAPVRFPDLRYVTYPGQDDIFVGHCLDLNIVVYSDKRQSCEVRLLESIVGFIVSSIVSNRIELIFKRGVRIDQEPELWANFYAFETGEKNARQEKIQRYTSQVHRAARRALVDSLNEIRQRKMEPDWTAVKEHPSDVYGKVLDYSYR